MLSTFPLSAAHLTLYGFVGCLTEAQADAIAEPFLKARAKARHDFPSDTPETTPKGEVAVLLPTPLWPRTAAHWTLYSLVGGLTWAQACYVRRPLLDLCERALVRGTKARRR